MPRINVLAAAGEPPWALPDLLEEKGIRKSLPNLLRFTGMGKAASGLFRQAASRLTFEELFIARLRVGIIRSGLTRWRRKYLL